MKPIVLWVLNCQKCRHRLMVFLIMHDKKFNKLLSMQINGSCKRYFALLCTYSEVSIVLFKQVLCIVWIILRKILTGWKQNWNLF